MKKLFIVLLLTALVPFAVGCNGLFSTDSDGSNSYWPPTTLASKATFSTVVTLPSTSGNGSIRASVAPVANAPIMSINGQDIVGVSLGNNQYRFTFEFNPKDLGAAATDQTLSIPYTIAYLDKASGEVKSVTTTAQVTVAAPAGSAAPITPATIVITITGVTVNDAPLKDDKGTAVVPTASYQVTSVVSEGKTLTNMSSTAVELTSLTPTFTLSFASVPAAGFADADWTVKVSKLNADGTITSHYTLTKASNSSLFGVTAGYAGHTESTNTVNITVADNTTHKLSKGTTYKVELLSSSNPVVINTVKYFKTVADPITPATLKDVTVNGTKLVGDTTKVDVNTSTTVALTLNGSSVVSAPTGEATVTLKRVGASDMTVKLTSANSSYSAGTLTLTFTKALTAASSYEATVAGTWANVTIPTTPIKFQTN